ncbi:B-type cyclin CLB2 KNAG_0A07680 [Huiozyma naganishii CBS 8797]|uniref:Uncharacterized protein n=1 Tax=Huiozyma naganishii (strain ATCC MYA-139 / BCRC 22969 / CBS 8797 / KCTC 17520 / NBRC 10181 / NCYC 3082 / Yp74L-3) TaxID=1071383 RepID=J7S472_HUIN7|nr:hypothetical protein KNAG_0A07680 [Kazachstania naganishii CBS 8797]CCK68421.1 hypothetical protein KNAG_0A07680 [Kazachstania naganishii CBS 8797]
MSSNERNTGDNINNASNKLSSNVQRLALNNVTNTTLSHENSIQHLKGTKPDQSKLSSQNLPQKEDVLRETVRTQPSFSDNKENCDPYTKSTGNSNPSISEMTQCNTQVENVQTIASTQSNNISHSNTAVEEKLIDTTKKRPISTVVEQEEPKKFKVCDENGEEEYIWEDLDAEDVNDPFMVSEYVNDIFEYLHRLEIITLPKKDDLYKHRNIRQNRDILVNWLVKIHNKFGLLPETLYLAINIMDRFLCRELVQLDKLQLVGTSCLFIASKYEEVYSPSIKHFASETDGACTEEEIKEGEKFILKTLEMNLNYPNPMNFLRRISKADDYDIQSRTLAKFLLEISLVDFRFIGMLPSLCAAAAMFLSRKMLGKGKWDGNLIHYCGGYTKTQLAPVCDMIMDYLTSPIVHDEFHRKYQSRRFMKASVISVQWALKVRKNGYDIMTLHETN